MDFKEATKAVTSRVTDAELAEEMGVSVPSIRQARLKGRAHAHRNPPDGWESAVERLAKRQIGHFQKLLGALEPRRKRD